MQHKRGSSLISIVGWCVPLWHLSIKVPKSFSKARTSFSITPSVLISGLLLCLSCHSYQPYQSCVDVVNVLMKAHYIFILWQIRFLNNSIFSHWDKGLLIFLVWKCLRCTVCRYCTYLVRHFIICRIRPVVFKKTISNLSLSARHVCLVVMVVRQKKIEDCTTEQIYANMKKCEYWLAYCSLLW